MKKNRFLSFLLVCVMVFQCAGLSVTAFADDSTSDSASEESIDDYAERANEVGTRIGTHIADFFNRVANQAETGLNTQQEDSEVTTDDATYNDRYTRVGNRIWNFFQRITSGITSSSAANDIAGVSTESVDDSTQADSGNAVYSSASGTQTASASAANAAAESSGCIVTITVTGGSYTYDGKAHTAEGYTVSISDTENYRIKNRDITLGSESQTDVGTTQVGVQSATVEVRDKDNHENITYTLDSIAVVKGTVTVTPADLTVTTPNATKEFDGTPLTSAGTLTGLVNGETAGFETTGTQTSVGTSDNTYKIQFNEDDSAYTAKKSNYNVNATVGQLTVTGFDGTITVTASGHWTYDGKTHSAESVTVTGLPDGYTSTTPTCSAQFTDVDDCQKELTAADFSALTVYNPSGTDVTKYVKFQYENTVVIDPIRLTVHTGSKEQVYDDTALTYTDDAHVYGALTGETIDIEATGSQTVVGSSKNTYELIFTDGEAKACNYTVPEANEDLGTLTVTANTTQITVTTVGNLPLNGYDGETHGAEVIITGLPSGFSAEGTSNASAREVTTTPIEAICNSLTITGPNGGTTSYTDEKLSSPYANFSNVRFIDTTLVINKATLIIRGGSADKTYDGTPLTDPNYTVTGLADSDEIVSVTITGTRTEVGSSPNTPSDAVLRSKIDGSDPSGNYEITYKDGTLKVTAQKSSGSSSSGGSSSGGSSSGSGSTSGGTSKSGTTTDKQTSQTGTGVASQTVTGRGTNTAQPQTTLKSTAGTIAAPASGVVEDITALVDNAYDASVAPTTTLAAAYGVSDADAKNGVWVWMELMHVDESAADPADKKLIEDVLGDRTLAFYFSVGQYKQIYGKNAEKLSQTAEELQISFTVPEQYRSDNREFGIIRTHDGEKAELLDSVSYDAGSGRISFKSDKFSLYALTYVDTENTTAVTVQTTAAEETSTASQHNLTPLYIAIAAVCGIAAGLLLTRIPKKRKTK